MTSSQLTAAILVVSETAAHDPESDASTGVLKDILRTDGGGQWSVLHTAIVPDSVLDIQRTITHWTDRESPVNLIITTGGTGFAKNDNTPEAIAPLLHKHAPGLVHGMLSASLTVTPFAMMSRPVAGVRNQTLILTLPGSPKGAKENLQSVLKLLPHACVQAAGADSRSLHAGGVTKLERDAGVGTAPVTSATSTSRHHHDHSHSHDHGHGHSHGSHAIPVAHTSPESHPRSNDPDEGPTRRSRASPYPMLSVADALELVASKTPAPPTTTAAVDANLVGAILAEDVEAAEPVPAFRASTVDGYAVVVSPHGPSTKGVFPVVSVSHASPGEIPALESGDLARITTGAPLPPGATSVIMVEDSVLRSKTDGGQEEREVEILTGDIKPGENVREVGSDNKAGDIVLRKGEEITAVGGELGLLASVGKREVSVYKSPVVGVLSTGDEIVDHDREAALRLGEVRDANRPALLAVARGNGFEAVDLGIARDTPGALEEHIRAALRAIDVLVTTGGVSMGELDLLKPTLERRLGGTIHFGRVAMKPGKPTTFASVPFKDVLGHRQADRLVFSLPGNPASAVVTFHIFVLPALQRLAGRRGAAGLPQVRATLAHDVRPDPARTEYHRARVVAGRDGGLHASSTGGQRSSRIGSLKGGNALLVLPAGQEPITAGSQVETLLMDKVGGILEA